MSCWTAGPIFCSKLPQCGHRKSSYIDRTTFGLPVLSLISLSCAATLIGRISPAGGPAEPGFLWFTIHNTTTTANTMTTATNANWTSTLPRRSAPLRSYRLILYATPSDYRRGVSSLTSHVAEVRAQRRRDRGHRERAAAAQRREVAETVDERRHSPDVDAHPGVAHPICIGFAFVSQRVEAGRDNDGGRQPGQV